MRIVDDAEPRKIAAPKPETLMAALLARRGQILTVDQLVAEIWAGPKPQRARSTVHVYVSRLRAILGVPGPARSGPLATSGGGYVLHPGPGRLDADAFHGLVERGRAASRAGRRHEAAETYTSALDLWRGPAYAGVAAGPIVRAHAARLEASRLECLELLVEAHLELGHYRESVARLYALTAEYPLHETFARHLMVALYHCGRRADALAVYRDTRGALRELLGLEPSRPLRDVQHAVLAGLELPGVRTDSLAG
ncbi:BTAD domain-containing putative transcriptional regulator [Embleya sp. NBC_00896]|uniref:AfsR/SARP family transcriptional regulator n=1 Tax=Embleya sp. NBC_00896 TaxID=2975961 RepID=UPI00386A971C|nr:AfsR/SARP family transcriptional regulator [Embleya sp. NBC_00896]